MQCTMQCTMECSTCRGRGRTGHGEGAAELRTQLPLRQQRHAPEAAQPRRRARAPAAAAPLCARTGARALHAERGGGLALDRRAARRRRLARRLCIGLRRIGLAQVPAKEGLLV